MPAQIQALWWGAVGGMAAGPAARHRLAAARERMANTLYVMRYATS